MCVGATARAVPEVSDLTEREYECLSTLMRLLATKKHATSVHTATKFLMARKFDMVRAWGLYECHLHRRRKYKLDTLDPHEEPLRGELQRNKFMFLGTRDKQGRAISLFHARNHFPRQSNPLTVMQVRLLRNRRIYKFIYSYHDSYRSHRICIKPNLLILN